MRRMLILSDRVTFNHNIIDGIHALAVATATTIVLSQLKSNFSNCSVDKVFSVFSI